MEHDVDDFVFGKYGMTWINPDSKTIMKTRIGRPFGGYGYSGWVCDFSHGVFQLKQGSKIIARETSQET